MRYDEEYNSFKFNSLDIEILIDALTYYHLNDKSIVNEKSLYIDNLYEFFRVSLDIINSKKYLKTLCSESKSIKNSGVL